MEPPLPAFRPLLSACALACAAAAFAPPTADAAPVVLTAPDTLLVGERPGIVVSGLAPLSEVTVESLRTVSTSVKADGKWTTQPLVFHARARFWADARGEVDVDRSPPIDGSYTGADPRGLLWSGAVAGRAPEPAAGPEAADLKPREVRLSVRVGGAVVATERLTLKPWAEDVSFTQVDTPGLTGVFAAPAHGRHVPTVILLHGSEGGDFASAKAAAGLWASHGYAAFALIYFAWPYAHVPNAPPAFTHLPVERIAAARDWLKLRPEADVNRLGVAGGSKGAEYGLLAASTYPWIRAVAACVPSSIVWGGFGAPLGAHPESFTLGGSPVPYVPYGDYGPVERGEITSAQRHQRDRAAAAPDAVARAAIPVERSRARLLLISGDRDAVWPSDAMSAEIVARMTRAGRARSVTWLSNPDAGHFQCGTGDGPIRANEGDEGALGGGLVPADGRGPGRAWEATLAFMGEALRGDRPVGASATRR